MKKRNVTRSVELSLGEIRLTYDGKDWTGNDTAAADMAAMAAEDSISDYDPDPVLDVAQRVAKSMGATIEKINSETVEVDDGMIN